MESWLSGTDSLLLKDRNLPCLVSWSCDWNPAKAMNTEAWLSLQNSINCKVRSSWNNNRVLKVIKLNTSKRLACVAGVQRGGREKVKFEREARSLGSEDPNDGASRSPCTSRTNFPSPLNAGHANLVPSLSRGRKREDPGNEVEATQATKRPTKMEQKSGLITFKPSLALFNW